MDPALMEGYAYLTYPFTSIDSKTIVITPAPPEDEQKLREFTGLPPTSNMQAWITIGGFDFSDEKARDRGP
ncbi:hypothetical protein F5882DRAFT_523950 [Hyaloscypha sp. PMI_1271]|nr:hypothetical protein F5882DRAFT_523950 [Hyaloscypha sp. PMI_1271]